MYTGEARWAARSGTNDAAIRLPPGSAPLGQPIAGAGVHSGGPAPAALADIAREPAGAVRPAISGRNRDSDAASGVDPAGQGNGTAIVVHEPIDDLHAISIGAIAAAALGHDQHAPRAVVGSARGGARCRRSDTEQSKNAGSEEMIDHWGPRLSYLAARSTRCRPVVIAQRFVHHMNVEPANLLRVLQD